MWTPRRIFLALVGLMAFAASYFGYARVLGTFDGLPPLPERYRESATPGNYTPVPIRVSTIDRKLQEAFGLNCPEVTYSIKTELKGRNVVVAARDFKIVPTGERAGWVQFQSLSLAVFGQKRGAEGVPEINTLYCDWAYLRFNKPIKVMSDLSDAHIVSAELQADPETPLVDPRKGRIKARNNRRTLDPNDDIDLLTPGPVYYEAEPKPGHPHIYTQRQTAVHLTDHLNTGLPEPNHLSPRDPTVAGMGMRIHLARDAKKKDPPKKGDPRLTMIPRKDPKPGVNGVDLVELDHAVEMNLWTAADASFVAPGGGKDGMAEVKKADPKAGPKGVEKRRLQIKTNGPFRYDLVKELAHFEKPAASRPGLIEHVVVTRDGRTVGQDVLDCEVLDIQLRRKAPPAPPKDAVVREEPAARKDKAGPGDGDLEIQSIKATGETVVMTSDSENLHATGTELTHDADAQVTVLKGSPTQPVQAVKDGNLLRGGEMHLFGDGKEITQGHVLGAGSVGLGELDPKTGEFFKQATWADRLVFTREPGGKDKPPVDVLVFLGKDKTRARFRDTSGGQLQEIEAMQLKVTLKTAERPDPKKKPAEKKAEAKKDPAQKDQAGAARPTRLEATGDVSSTAPDLVIKHANELDVQFRDVDELMKPPAPPAPKAKGPAAAPKGDAPVAKGEPAPKAGDGRPKAEEKKDPPPAKKPIVVSARKIKALVNRDPHGRNELDNVVAEGDVQARQDPTNKDDLGTDIAGSRVVVQAYKEGNVLTVKGVEGADERSDKWGVVRFDKLTMFGFDIVISQPDNTSNVVGRGSMEILSNTTMEGKKLAQPSTMTIYWKHRMEFLGADKLIYYHGAVQGYQEDSRLKCEWMQVLLDRPVYLNQALKPKEPARPGEKRENNNPSVDTVMCFHEPRDADVPKPKHAQPVTVVQEEKEGNKVLRVQTIRAPEVVTQNTPLEGGKSRKDLTATSSATQPGEVRMWQPGQKDGLAERPPAKDDPKTGPPKKKGELGQDQEMQLTVVHFGGKMIANDFRKRAKFFTNVKTVHLPADRPDVPVDLREGTIPVGAVYLEARDSLDVFATEQMEKDPKTGEVKPKLYQEMIALGSVHVRKQGEFVGDADTVKYSELKGTLTFQGSARNPAVVNRLQGQGRAAKPLRGETIIYYVKDKTFEVINASGVGQ